MKILKIAIATMAFVLATSFVPLASAQQAGAQKPLYERLGCCRRPKTDPSIGVMPT